MVICPIDSQRISTNNNKLTSKPESLSMITHTEIVRTLGIIHFICSTPINTPDKCSNKPIGTYGVIEQVIVCRNRYGEHIALSVGLEFADFRQF